MRAASFLVGMLVAGAASGQDAMPGRLLYEASCGGCHYERIHKRPPERTKVKSLEALRDMVARWAPQASRPLSLDEREAIVQYLNRSHYKLEK